MGVKNTGTILKQVEQQAYGQVEEEINNTLGNKFDTAFEAIRADIEKMVCNFIEQGNGGAEFNMLVEKFKSKLKKDYITPERFRANMEKDINQYLESTINYSKNQIMNSIKGMGESNNSDIVNIFYGYTRKVILNTLNERLNTTKIFKNINTNFQNYKKSLAGYYQEEMLTKAFNNVLNNFGLGAQSTGSYVNKNAEQIEIDIMLGTTKFNGVPGETIQDILKTIPGSVSGVGLAELRELGFTTGIQSKSWIAPWEKVNKGLHHFNTKFLNFGNHSGLIPSGDDAYYWHAGVTNVMSNLSEIIGSQNTIFATGNGVYFSADLLTQFRAQGYVFAFYKPKDGKITSGTVQAMAHNDK